MKFLNKIGAWAVMALAMTACVDQDPDIQDFPSADVDFTYEVADDEYQVDYYVVSQIRFNNTSAKTGALRWNFGRAVVEYVDGSASSNNPVVMFKQAGRYNVSLTVEGVGTRTYPILIADIQPKLTSVVKGEDESDLVVVGQTAVSFEVDTPNPQGKKIEYTLTFPSGTTDAETGLEVENPFVFVREVLEDGTYKDTKDDVLCTVPSVKFAEIGSRKVTVDAKFDFEGDEQRNLEQSYFNVQVACDVPAPTLYYAEKDGNIKALKLVDDSKYTVYPYDMGVVSGDNPFNLCYAAYDAVNDEGVAEKQEYIYILDCGKKYYYSSAPDGEGDGKITAMRVDGTGVNTVISNVGMYGFNDPYWGFVVDETLYYSDRNQGIRKMSVKDRNQMETATTVAGGDNYLVKWNWLNYYGSGISYGAIPGGIYYDKSNKWWVAMHYSGAGVYRFKNSDIHTDGQIGVAKPYPIFLSGSYFKTFTIDEDRNKFYAWSYLNKKGFFVYDLPSDSEGSTFETGKGYVAAFDMEADPINTTASEGVFTTQMAVDKTTGNVFFAFRASSDEKAYKTGIYYYNPDSTPQPVIYGETEGEAGLGLVINPNPSQLF